MTYLPPLEALEAPKPQHQQRATIARQQAADRWLNPDGTFNAAAYLSELNAAPCQQ